MVTALVFKNHGWHHHRSWVDIIPHLAKVRDRGSKYIIYILYAYNKKYTL